MIRTIYRIQSAEAVLLCMPLDFQHFAKCHSGATVLQGFSGFPVFSEGLAPFCYRASVLCVDANRVKGRERVATNSPDAIKSSQRATSNRWGASAVNQSDLRRLAEERIKDAKALIGAARWEFAYYAAGYAVECALKSCVLARMVHTGWVFDEAVKNASECRTHEFLKLMQIADIQQDLDIRLKQSVADGDAFDDNWRVAKAWNVVSRYESKTEAEAKKLYAAITDEPYGVLKWIQNYW